MIIVWVIREEAFELLKMAIHGSSSKRELDKSDPSCSTIARVVHPYDMSMAMAT